MDFWVAALGFAVMLVVSHWFKPKLTESRVRRDTDLVEPRAIGNRPMLLDYGSKARFLCIVDFECTCDQPNRADHEIIEFPIVLIDRRDMDLGIYDRRRIFRTFVRPSECPRLSKFCTELTGVRQSDVDAALTLDEALIAVDEWLREAGADLDGGRPADSFVFCTDGPTDFKKFLDAECRRKGIGLPGYYARWVDVSKHLLRFHSNTKCTLVEKVIRVGLQWSGRPHCGVDDASNIANLVAHLHKKGCALTVNDGVPCLPKSERRKNKKKNNRNSSIA